MWVVAAVSKTGRRCLWARTFRRGRMPAGLGRWRGLLCTITLVGLLGGCHTDPYETYASAVRRDVDQSASTLGATRARLQLTIVHGHVPLDSAPVWASELGRAAKVLHEHQAHLAKLGPPDPEMAQEHDGLLAELSGIADSVASLGDAMGACTDSKSRPPTPATAVSAASTQPRSRATDSLAALDAQIDSEARMTADSIAAACRASVGDALSDLTRRVSYAQDQLRWTRQRVGRKLATHGVLLGDVSLRPSHVRPGQ